MNVAFRVDASSLIGTGHVMRCLTLADALREQGCDILFISRDEPGNLSALVRERGFEVAVLDAAETLRESNDGRESANILRRSPVDLVVVDHYALSADWERQTGKVSPAVMAIDDLPHRNHDCDILLDQNLHGDDIGRAPLPTRCRPLLGPAYALLRRQFAEHRGVCQQGDAVRSVVVSLGGGDCAAALALVVSHLRTVVADTTTVTVIANERVANDGRLRAQCEALPSCTIQSGVDNMAALLARADLAIGAGGVSSLERCCLGLPSVVVSIADNQVEPSAALARQGCQLFLGPLDGPGGSLLGPGLRVLWDNAPLRSHFWRRGRALVDGMGARRVAGAILNRGLSIRPATQADSDWMRAWRNAEAARRASNDARYIEPDEHRAWISAVLADPDRCLLVGEHLGRAVAVLRYDIEGDAALISIYLEPGSGGIGIGSAVLDAGERWMNANRPAVRLFRADIVETNQRSRRAFRKAGFEPHRIQYIKQV